MPHHNGYHIVSHRSQLVQVWSISPLESQIHPSASTLKVDEEGLYPEWVLYHELVASPRPYLRHVCVVEASWVAPALSKLQNVNISSLSGQGARRASSNMDAVQAGGVVINIEKILSSGGNEGSHVEIEAARARFLARKQSKTIKL
jgi:ATP-dependent RNA helicase DHX8/PRP22